jgi:hypothetical protein
MIDLFRFESPIFNTRRRGSPNTPNAHAHEGLGGPPLAKHGGRICSVLAERHGGEQVAVTATGDWPHTAIQRAAMEARQHVDGRLSACAN